jgi:glycine cleavage system T protein (aminomethyltransferase)
MTTSSTASSAAQAPLRRTPLYDLHLAHGAKMVAFAGYEMPVQYAPGVLKEHLHTRQAAGLFDVSHMGQIALRPRSGSAADVAAALEQLVPADIVGLGAGRQRYTVLTNAQGGILDDLMVANLGSHLLLVVNAATKAADEAHLRAQLPATCAIEPTPERALLALQGPRAEAVLAAHEPSIAAMRFMDVRAARIAGAECLLSRSGYTGEDGFEIGLSADAAAEVAGTLLRHEAVAPIGLAARDSLRLEAGLCLYGSDLDADTDPVEAALEWTIPKSRRAGGSRAGGFPGADVVLAALASGARRRRIGLRPEGRAPVRAGAQLYADAEARTPVGVVTSGGYGPTLAAPIAMGYVERASCAPGTRLFAEVRGARLPVLVAALPFVPHTYKRG